MILFVYLESLNYVPSAGVFYDELKKKDNINVEILDPGLHSLQEISGKIKSADIIVFDVSLVIAMGEKSINSLDFFILHKKPKEFYYHVWDQIYNSSKPVFLFAPSADLHSVNFGLSRNLYLGLLKRCNGIFWPFFRYPIEKEKIPEKYNSMLPSRGIQESDFIGIWKEIIQNISINIDLPHCVSASEFMDRPKKKKWDFIVPGEGYSTRKIAYQSAVERGLHVAPFNQYRRFLVTFPHYVYKNLLSRKKSISIRQKHSFAVYRRMISHSAVSFTCGSELKFFVRKFIEIPTLYSAMVAYPTENFRDYGFEEGIHYVHALPEEAAEKAQFLLGNKSYANKLAQNAWSMVKEKHTASQRVNQVLLCLQNFEKGKLKGACFKDGNFEIF